MIPPDFATTARQLIRDQEEFCIGHREIAEPWCSTLRDAAPLCVVCQKHANAIAAALVAAYQQGEEYACARLRQHAKEHAEQLRLIAARIVNSTVTNLQLRELLARPSTPTTEPSNG